MTKRIVAVLTAILIAAAAALGIVERQTYTDITSEPDYLSYFQVAELPESLAETATETLSEALPESSYILRVIADGGIEHLYSNSRQKVTVQEVYQGDGIEAGDEFYITHISWRLVFPQSFGVMATEMGFVNFMEDGGEYLIFLNEKLDTLDGDDTYSLVDFIIAPVFSYDDHENVIAETSGDSTYVDYDLVRENEFFASTETTLAYMLELKSAMLALYPR